MLGAATRTTRPDGRSGGTTRARRAGTAAVLAGTLLAGAACGTAEPAPPAGAASAPAPGGVDASPTGTPAAPAGTPTAPAVLPESLRFAAKNLDGTPFDTAALAGKPVVLWFWAPWCATCASQAWTIAEVAPAYRDTVPVIGVAGLGEQRAMKDFVTEFELAGVPQIEDRRGALWRRFEVVEQSTFVILDRTGTIIHRGFLDGEDLTRRLKALAA
ncbi:TlpA family protein disulfide reductase [Micromonospora endolithica]|uniref:Redoxin n=1 Tax=Micromonospora endolithica TaxID=230091 RepID=A0A3A9ZST6_9ACTN|nr:redoxin domain-containing protein [Micromonospora endolithica]RKN51024.1 redoxin [Micromonospora endolithica]TWJ20180.1 thiol-disulfide isomerase/thioredoxin [Micromonospora endolithica]